MTWDALNARARGLATHLLTRARLEALLRHQSLPELAEALEQAGYPITRSFSAADIELAARRALGRRLRVLSRWAQNQQPVLTVIFEEEERRSVSALLRGAAQQAPPPLRLSGLVPTPELPERALEALAAQRSVTAVLTLLRTWGHHLAGAIRLEHLSPEPDLLRVETSLSQAAAARSLAAARALGRRGLLLREARLQIDLLNTWTVLTLAPEPEPSLDEFWIPGGAALRRGQADRALHAGDALAAARLVAGAFPVRLARVFAAADHPGGLEAAVLAARIALLRDEARRAPLSPAPLLTYALRLRAEALDVRRIAWGLQLGTPTDVLRDGLVSA